MALRMSSDRRSFFGKVFGGLLVALGLKREAPMTMEEIVAWDDAQGSREVNCSRWNANTRSSEFIGGYAKMPWVIQKRREGWTVRVGK